MAVHAPHPSDVLVTDLVNLYSSSTRRLEGIVAAGLRRGLTSARLGTPRQRAGDSTHAYRERQLQQAHALLDQLHQQAGQVAPIIIGRSYGAGLVAVDATVGPGRLTGRFGRVHTRAVEAIAANMTSSLQANAERARVNVATVFARAAAIEGALPASGRVAGVQFIGRRIDDPYRRVALNAVGEGIVSLDTRRQVSAQLVRKLINEGVTDAVTGYVDRAGRRWPLDVYARMVARTTTREAMTAGTMNRLTEHGLDLVTISSHDHKADECTPYDGNTYSLSGNAAGYELLPESPPFHAGCLHVLTPAAANLDAFEAELARAAAGPLDA